jgi:hypothetical protein
MEFVRLWLTGYVRPARFIDELRSKPAPYWGVYGQLLRAGLDSILVFLPVALMGRVPPTPSYVSAIPTEAYYAALVGLGPIVLIVELLIGTSFLHVAIRLSGRPSDFDQILNVVDPGRSGVARCSAQHSRHSCLVARGDYVHAPSFLNRALAGGA